MACIEITQSSLAMGYLHITEDTFLVFAQALGWRLRQVEP